ncbi:phage envelope protein [Taibaiella sp. KBW10]|uniref:DUF1398 domain-containing protein n=1 Tax=Taibaiella sp. KBW10 TaxID=2153357 RepID=UPI000F5AC55F|nr:DUF1398 family protein [Taibaiella sp. KBW10]RQO32268.1 phage envelope protein [Taibaiella sp. KBW10]
MFTIDAIEKAHEKVRSGADFPGYIQEIKAMGVIGFETFVADSHTRYYGAPHFERTSSPQYEALTIASESNKEQFVQYLKTHQQGQTDYNTFCRHCAETGIEKWIVSLDAMTCIYYDLQGREILVETIPG